jgi:serine/alanine adding enzyme
VTDAIRTGIRVVEVGDEPGRARWDAYVGPRASAVTDLSAWSDVVGRAYGLTSWLLSDEESGNVVGALSLYEARHPVFGHYLATAPFGNDGGLLFDTPAARDALASHARAVADRAAAAYLVIRCREEELDGFVLDRRYQTATVDLDGGAERVWAALPAKTRNQVRKGMKEGFTLGSGRGQMGAFFDVFTRHMRDLGSPAHRLAFYEAIVDRLGDRVDFIVVRDGGSLVGGALLTTVNGTAANYHTVALKRYGPRCPNYLLYWKMIEMSCDRGCGRFDMGRSERNSTNIAFKANWSPSIVDLRYNFYLRTARRVPFVDPRNPAFRIPILVWQHLPLFLTRAVGPRLISGLL